MEQINVSIMTSKAYKKILDETPKEIQNKVRKDIEEIKMKTHNCFSNRIDMDGYFRCEICCGIIRGSH